MIVLALLAWAHDDEPPPLAPVPVIVAPIPAGPAVEMTATPGAALDPVIQSLPAGSTLHLPAGTYPGPVHIDRPMTLTGASGSVIAGRGTGTVLVITANDVRVTQLAVRGGGADATQGDAGVLVAGDRVVLDQIEVSDSLTGIDLRDADDGAVTNCIVQGKVDRALGQRGDGIRLWESDHNHIVGNHLEKVRDLVIWYSESNEIADNEVRDSRYGAHFMHASHNVVRNNHFEQDVVGIFVMYSDGLEVRDNLVAGANGVAGMGFGFKESDQLTVTGNRIFGNTTGLYLDHTPHRIGGLASFLDNTLAYNHAGLRIHGSETGAVFQSNTFHENATQVSVDGRADASGTLFQGNTWTDYTGYDLNGDGVGDLPYAPRTVTGSLAERHPNLAFFADTPAAGLLELLAQVFPMFGPQPILTDAVPVLG